MAGRGGGFLGQDTPKLGAGQLRLAGHYLQHERLAQPPARPVEEHFRGSLSEPEGGGDLSGAEAEVRDERYGRGVATREAGHAAFDPLGELRQLGKVGWPGRGVCQVERSRGVQYRDAPAAAKMVRGEVACDRREPRPKARSVLEAAEAVKGAEERVLDKVGDGFGVVTDQARGNSFDRAGVNPVQLCELGGAPPADGIHEFRIALPSHRAKA